MNMDKKYKIKEKKSHFAFCKLPKHICLGKKCLLMLTCIVKLWAEQKRTLSTAAWRIMTGYRTAAADQENAWGNRSVQTYIVVGKLPFTII